MIGALQPRVQPWRAAIGYDAGGHFGFTRDRRRGCWRGRSLRGWRNPARDRRAQSARLRSRAVLVVPFFGGLAVGGEAGVRRFWESCARSSI